jgi:hypothetical protein
VLTFYPHNLVQVPQAASTARSPAARYGAADPDHETAATQISRRFRKTDPTIETGNENGGPSRR